MTNRVEDEPYVLTVGEIRHAIRGLGDDVEVTFGQTLNCVPIRFYRFKMRDAKLLQIELNVDDLSLEKAERLLKESSADDGEASSA
jgi:hypothetical protein